MTAAVAIIGAGMAGLSAARKLKAAGVSVTLFDKGRGLGGRMSTRRQGEMQFDHGAQYFTARGTGFQLLVRELKDRGAVAEWSDGMFVGTPGMSAIGRVLGEDLPIFKGATVETLARSPHGWRVSTTNGNPGQVFDAVLLATPAPQATTLLATAGVRFEPLQAVRYAPCWALMVAFAGPVGPTADFQRFETGPIAWIANDSSKPGRAADIATFVAHASPEWSRAHLERTPDEVLNLLGPSLLKQIPTTFTPNYQSAHRWRYALVETPARSDCFWDTERNIGACGDWCLGGRVEAAFDSGEAAAKAILET
jgi:renalase